MLFSFESVAERYNPAPGLTSVTRRSSLLNPLIAVFVIALAVLGVLIGRPLLREYRRRRLSRQPLPAEWRTIVTRALPLYEHMPAGLRRRLDGLIQQFVAEKEFVGCRGLEVTLEMKLSVAAQACLLILNRSGHLYDKLFSILLYPAAFVVPEEDHDDAGVVTRRESVLTGQAWETQRIILSWDDVQAGSRESSIGYNVVFHEFAHYLDAEDGGPEGGNDAEDSVMNREYEALIAAAERGEETLLDPYGAEDEAEFFAVCTESFFEQPAAMKARHPELYAALAGYYRLDPLTWI